MKKKIKVLSIRPPWPGAIFCGLENAKDVENRTWYTPFRGRLYIHASRTYEDGDEGFIQQMLGTLPDECQLRGVIVGHVEMCACRSYNDTRSDWHMNDQYGFYLRNPVKLKEPVPLRGQLKIFTAEIDEELLAEEA